jgi:polysaccharide deacetylase family protein (PEP-CTERM system associated)
MSVDVEDYFQVEAFADSVTRDSWDSWPSRVVRNTRRILHLFEGHEATATFFFVGWVARRFPSLVREVQSHGHEVACHSYWHRPVKSLTPKEFRQDTRIALDAIEQAAGVKVEGYRAPTWSIDGSCFWALDILAEEGFSYDSSIFPISHDLYGMRGAPRFTYKHRCPNGLELWEFPPTTIRVGGFNLPAVGGGYLRIFPLQYNLWALHHIEQKYAEPVVVYFHPWEIDTEQPRIPAGLKSRFRHYTKLGSMESRLIALLQHRSFSAFRDLMAIETSHVKRPRRKTEGGRALASFIGHPPASDNALV